MAGGFYRENEHAFVTIGRDMKEGKIPPLVLLCGSEEYLVRWYADALVKKYVNDAVRAMDLVILEGDRATVENIEEGLETLSLMSERKVVLLPDFAPAVGKEPGWISKSDMKELVGYMENIPEGSMLIMTAGEPEDRRKKKNQITTAAGKYGKVYDFQPLGDGQLRSFIEKRFRSAGKRCAGAVTHMIMSDSGYGNKAVDYDLYNLENDLRKIIAHSGDSPEITAADVRGVISVSPENDVFAMLDAIGRNRKDEAFRLLHNLMDSGTPVYRLLNLITGQLELILSVKEMRDEGRSSGEMQKKLGVHQFRIKKAMSMTGLYSMDDLRKVMSAAYEVDETIKTGLMDGGLALEYFIANV